MSLKPGPALGTIYRGSTRHRILAELERYPDTWVRWYQIPGLEDIAPKTVQSTFQRLIRERRVEGRRVFDVTMVRGLWYTEIRHRDDEGGA